MNLRIKLRKNQSTIPAEKLTPEVSSLEVIGENIERLPSLAHLENCRNLLIVCPELKELPAIPKSLEVFKVNGGKVLLPMALPHLNHLQLKSLALESLAPLSDLPSTLETLDLSNNRFIHLPGEIESLKKLVRLNLDGNSLVTLPEFLYRLPSLNHLSLDGNPLSEDTKNELHRKFGMWF